jgi:predicted transcriptional regulator
MTDYELSLEQSDAKRREAIAAAEEAVLALVEQAKPSSPQELRSALADAELDFDQATLRTALLRLLNQGRVFGDRQAAAAAQ